MRQYSRTPIARHAQASKPWYRTMFAAGLVFFRNLSKLKS